MKIKQLITENFTLTHIGTDQSNEVYELKFGDVTILIRVTKYNSIFNIASDDIIPPKILKVLLHVFR